MHVEHVSFDTQQVIRGRDHKFAEIFARVLESSGIEIKKPPVRSPNLNAYAERFIQTLKQECLAHLVIFGQRHLDYLATSFVDYYQTQRPHQAKGNRPLLQLADSPAPATGALISEERLGELLNHYYRKAA